MQVTISLLPVSLSLVHIPRSRLAQLSHPVLRQILQPNPAFLNITCNEVELSLFADEAMLQDFEPIARRDRLKQRARSGSTGSSSNHGRIKDTELVEISHDKWSVIQVDSHNDQIDTSGARVNEVSALLAAAGISILYQSSYMSDFIFVKESRLQDAMNLFAASGFDLYSSDPTLSLSEIVSSTYHPRDRSSVHDFRPAPGTNAPAAILTRNRSATDPHPAPSASGKRSAQVRDLTSPLVSGLVSPSDNSHSLTADDVHLLPSDLACVGLSDELGVDHWGLKIVKLVAFPDLISAAQPLTPIPSVPSSNTESIFSSRNVSTPLFELSPPILDPLASRVSSSSGSSSSSSEEDGYFSHSPPTKHTMSFVRREVRSYSELKKHTTPSLYGTPSKHLISSPSLPLAKSQFTSQINGGLSGPQPKRSRVPFFSYTKTLEGCSLTADVYVLATLFPPHERHMVICSGELDAADQRLKGGTESSDDENEEDDPLHSLGSTLTCLQIDLRRFGLDKHGLVNRFSQVLDEKGINHMYSSTFRTANLLVGKKHAARAQALLQAC